MSVCADEKSRRGVKIILSSSLRVQGLSTELRVELEKRLCFTNPKWLENHRMGRWNRGVARRLKFYRRLSGGGLQMPRGYIRQLLLLCREREIPWRIDDRRRGLAPVDFTFQGQLKAFQQEAVEIMAERDFGTLCAPTGSGKTVMALHLVAQRRQPTLIVVHTSDLARQWVARIQHFLGLAAEEVGRIGGGRRRLGERITVAMVQTLCKCADEVAPKIGFLVVDECHRCPSRTFTEAVSSFDSRYMLGLTATPWRRDNLADLIFWHLGSLHHRVPRKELVDSGDVLPATVIYRPTTFEPFHDPVQEYSKMLVELTCDDQRNRMIAEDVAREARRGQGVCLVLSDRKSHCETLRALLAFGHKIDAELLTGDLPREERKQVLEKVRDGRCRVLVATGQLMGEGIDCRELTKLFLTTPIRFSGRLVQYLGRVLRPLPGKERAVVYDYVDERVPALAAAARARRQVYGQ